MKFSFTSFLDHLSIFNGDEAYFIFITDSVSSESHSIMQLRPDVVPESGIRMLYPVCLI